MLLCIHNFNYLKDSSYKRKKMYSRFYNFYSLDNFINFYRKFNYETIFCKKFEIKKTINKNFKKNMGTYTLKKQKKNIQISGPLLMNWYFIIFKKKS